ncbi:ATP-binding cassette domain-containing protein [Streptomyces sp. NBC_01723]|uniref:ABC transporter ATP-binding protein n=1 Tax=Streptomyces sp. NBC_01723 TaxID=2975921 RepID=UPI002E36828E|nr:ATP-binding cassette domain-containing protein [Streptomyces sp. NBC_01723]
MTNGDTYQATTGPLLAARDLVKTYGRTEALRGVSVDLRAGEILAVTGASGSGKSTLLHCLAGIVRPDAGSVTYSGRPLEGLPEHRLSELRRTDFGVVFQFGQLIPELTALDNVALPLMLAGTARAEARARAGEWLERFGVRGQEELRPGEMSGGQAQRAALDRPAGRTGGVRRLPAGGRHGSAAAGALGAAGRAAVRVTAVQQEGATDPNAPPARPDLPYPDDVDPCTTGGAL